MINVNSSGWVYKVTPNYRNKTLTIRAYVRDRVNPVRKWRTYKQDYDDFLYYAHNYATQRDIEQLIYHSGECYIVK